MTGDDEANFSTDSLQGEVPRRSMPVTSKQSVVNGSKMLEYLDSKAEASF